MVKETDLNSRGRKRMGSVVKKKSPSATRSPKQKKVLVKSTNNNAIKLSSQDKADMNKCDGIQLTYDPGEDLDYEDDFELQDEDPSQWG